MVVSCKFDKDEKPSEETLKRLAEALKTPVVVDDDCPELTGKQIEQIREQRKNQLSLAKKKNVSIRLSNKTIDTAKKFGKGYTNLIAEIVETTFSDENLLKKYIK